MPDASMKPRDDSHFEQVFRAYAGFAERVLRRFGVQPRDVADAAQDVFVVVHRRLPELEQPAALRSWMYRICARVAADYRKRAHRRYERLDESAADAAVADAQEGAARHAQLVERLERALDGLADDQRHVFVLFELEELRMAEVAELLGCPLKTAFSRLYAARREVRADLRRAGFACVPWALWSLSPWKARAAVELHSALQAVGVAGEASCIAASSPVASALPLAPLAATASHALQTGAVVAGWGHVTSIASATGLVTVLALAMPPLSPAEGSTLAHGSASAGDDAAYARRSSYQLAPRSTRVPERAPAPMPLPAPRRLTRALSSPAHVAPPEARAAAPSSLPAPTASPAASAPPAPLAEHAWIRAPASAPAAPPVVATSATAKAATVGLDDEVLTATSVESLMRLSPARGAARRPWVLVPARRAQRASH